MKLFHYKSTKEYFNMTQLSKIVRGLWKKVVSFLTASSLILGNQRLSKVTEPNNIKLSILSRSKGNTKKASSIDWNKLINYKNRRGRKRERAHFSIAYSRKLTSTV